MAGGWGSAYAAIAGLLGALAACSAKLALGADYLRGVCVAAVGPAASPCDWVRGGSCILLKVGSRLLVVEGSGTRKQPA